MHRQGGGGASGHEIGDAARFGGPHSGEHRRGDERARRRTRIGDILFEGTRAECETEIAERSTDQTLTTRSVPPLERAAAAGDAPHADDPFRHEVFGDRAESRGAGCVDRVGCRGHGSQPAVQTGQLEHLAHGPRQARQDQPALAGSARFFQRDQRPQSDARQVRDAGEVEHPEGGVVVEGTDRFVELRRPRRVKAPAQREHGNAVGQQDLYIHATTPANTR